jgi:membrane protein implicated in regulation of membrane protease activity
VISSEILVPNLAAVNLISADIATRDSQILLKLTIIISIIFFFILHHFLLVLHRPLSFEVLKDPKTKPL